MKKNIIITGVAALALASSLQAQSLIGGFDFSTLAAGGTEGANYSDLGLGGAVNDGDAAGAAYAAFSFEDGPGNPFAMTQYAGFNLSAGLTLFSEIRVLGFNDTMEESGGSLQAEDIGFATADGGFFDVTVTPGSTFTDYRFGFAAGQLQDGTSSLAVSYSTDGGSNFNLLQNVNVTTRTNLGGQAYDIDASGFSASNVIFRVGFTDIDIGILIDNVQVAGTAVPEPSTFAAIFGVIALGFAAIRRRR